MDDKNMDESYLLFGNAWHEDMLRLSKKELIDTIKSLQLVTVHRCQTEKITLLESLGAKGYRVLIAYGPMQNKSAGYLVDVMTPDGQSFEKPFAALGIEHAIYIADNEIKMRGW